MNTKAQFLQNSSLCFDDLIFQVYVVPIQNHWIDGPDKIEFSFF